MDKPAWLRVEIGPHRTFGEAVRAVLREEGLSTVCTSARCPNLPTCWGAGTATFMILGDICTRTCRFCAVSHGKPLPPEPTEPVRLARAIRKLGLRYVVLTSVDRDDLPDGGASHFAACICTIKEAMPEIKVEILIPDFSGGREALQAVVEAGPDVVGHNLETVRRLTPRVRDRRASYELSLQVLRTLKDLNPKLFTKSSILLGLGEGEGEVEEALEDLRSAGVDIVVLGQYLRPTARELPVARYVPPEEFAAWEKRAKSLGFRAVLAGPLVRTSFKAAEVYKELLCASSST
ncbi:MAG: lipoyl synthase [Candidatus Bipolaricaulaceae bacterium]